MALTKKFSTWLTTRYQLVIRNEDDLAEKRTFRFNYAKLIVLGVALFSALSACSVMLSKTLLAAWLNPAYMAQENQRKLTHLATTLEALESQNKEQQQFIGLLQQIIAGKEVKHSMLAPAEANAPTPVQQDSAQAETTLQLEDDAALQDEGDVSSALPPTSAHQPAGSLQDLYLFAPVNGIITTPFKQKTAHYGVDIVAKAQEPIKCVADGVVVLAEYTLATGWVIIVQHHKNLVSIYKHNASLFKKVGSFVGAGDIIAIMGNSGELSSGPHLHFELWYEGNPVDPEHFIAF